MTAPRALLLLLLLAGCMRAPARPAGPAAGAPEVDSVTVALWHMDEQAGIRVADSGPFRLDGTAGRAVRRPFGRHGGGLGFEASIESFVFVPFNPSLETVSGLTVEAWVFPTQFGTLEDTPIAARWSEEANRQSWILSLAGTRIDTTLPATKPSSHRLLFPDALAGKVMFAYQPVAAGAPRVYVSTRPIELHQWTHVAATFDGSVVRLYLDGELDAQFASMGPIRGSQAPLLIGNSFDVRLLTGFGGDLRPEGLESTSPYSFQGTLDELRISSAARADFPTLAPR